MFADVNGTQIHYVQEGTGRDLVLLPGLGASTHVWYPQLKGLSSVLRVTALDPRGHGQSGKPTGPYTMRMLADDVAGTLRHAGINSAVVAGSSMSSLVAVELAVAYPDLVAAVVLVGGFPILGPAARERFDARAKMAEAEGMGPLADLVAAGAMGAHTHATQPALVGLFRHVLLANDPTAYATCCRMIRDADVTPLLGQVRCPTLILWGVQEQVAPLPAAQALKAGIPHAQLCTIADAGHLPFMEQPGAFNAAVTEFIAGLP